MDGNIGESYRLEYHYHAMHDFMWDDFRVMWRYGWATSHWACMNRHTPFDCKWRQNMTREDVALMNRNLCGWSNPPAWLKRDETGYAKEPEDDCVPLMK